MINTLYPKVELIFESLIIEAVENQLIITNSVCTLSISSISFMARHPV